MILDIGPTKTFANVKKKTKKQKTIALPDHFSGRYDSMHIYVSVLRMTKMSCAV